MFKTVKTLTNLSFNDALDKFKQLIKRLDLPKVAPFIAQNKKIRIEMLSVSAGVYVILIEKWISVQEIAINDIVRHLTLKNFVKQKFNISEIEITPIP